MKGRVYKITENNSDEITIGSTIRKLNRRLLPSSKEKTPLAKRIAERGRDNFNTPELIAEYDICDIHQLHAMQQLWMNKLKRRITNKRQAFKIPFRCYHIDRSGKQYLLDRCTICKNGRNYCSHKNRKGICVKCKQEGIGGDQLCDHNIPRTKCKHIECGAGSWCRCCTPPKLRSMCSKCLRGGGQLCQEHGKPKQHCKDCYPAICDECNKVFTRNYLYKHKQLHETSNIVSNFIQRKRAQGELIKFYPKAQN